MYRGLYFTDGDDGGLRDIERSMRGLKYDKITQRMTHTTSPLISKKDHAEHMKQIRDYSTEMFTAYRMMEETNDELIWQYFSLPSAPTPRRLGKR